MFKELLDIILNVKIFVFIYRPICVISEIFLLERLTVMNGTKGYLSFLGSGTTLIIHIRHLLNYESILCSVYVREQPLILVVVICFLSLPKFHLSSLACIFHQHETDRGTSRVWELVDK